MIVEGARRPVSRVSGLPQSETIKGICARDGSDRYWQPLHAGCDGATVFADLTPAVGPPDPAQLARFFD